MNIQEQEERDFTHTSATEWDRAEAYDRGAADPDVAWVLTDRDVWHANPYYEGPEVPHPEDVSYYSEEEEAELLSYQELDERR